METMNLFGLFKRKSPTRPTVARRPAAGAMFKTGAAARSPMSTQEPKLSPAAQEWVRGLPVKLRPLELCSAYPRVANRLALCWSDLELVDSVFNELLLDRRGGRLGFPTGIAAELMRLHALHERRVAASDGKQPTAVAR